MRAYLFGKDASPKKWMTTFITPMAYFYYPQQIGNNFRKRQLPKKTLNFWWKSKEFSNFNCKFKSLSSVLKTHLPTDFKSHALFFSIKPSSFNLCSEKELIFHTLVVFLHYCSFTNSPSALSSSQCLMHSLFFDGKLAIVSVFLFCQ